MTEHPPISLDDLAEHIRDIRTALTALGRQPTIDADSLSNDMLEICLSMNPPVAAGLVTEIAASVLAGQKHRGR